MENLLNILHFHRYQPVAILNRTPTTVLKAKDTSPSSFANSRGQPRLVVVKCHRRGLIHDDVTRLTRAAVVHIRAHHPCVVRLYEVFNAPTHVCFAMEYVPGGNLRQLVDNHVHAHGQGIEEGQARLLFCDVVQGIRHLHSKDVAYRQVKLEHVLLTEDHQRAKICDFLFARMGSSVSMTKLGSPHYIAPEVWELPNNNVQWSYDGKMVDVWGCGVLLYYMVFGYFPFDVANDGRPPDQRVIDLSRKITEIELTLPENDAVTADCRELIEWMLSPVQERITMDELVQQPWFIGGDRIRLDDPSNPLACQTEGNIIDVIAAAAVID